MNTQRIPLQQLQVAPGNVRKTGGVPIYKLANSILAHGLLQNLVVSPAGDKFEVVAGGRRLQALQSLASNGDLPTDFEVTCNVLGAVSAHEASLAENVAREAMHPVDEFHAFKQLVDDEKLTPAEIAERFGCTERHVAQRLRLANVAPRILAEYRDGKATLEQMQALALVDDHKVQEAAWGKDRQPNDWSRQPQQLRAALIAKDVSVDSSLGKFVGLEAYRAAGGKLREDLFVDYASMPDTKLVQRLATEKLEAEAEKLRKKGWGWVEVRTEEPNYSERSKYREQRGAAPSDKLGVILFLSRYNGVDSWKGLVKPGAKAPPSKKKGAAAGKTVRGKDLENQAHQPLYALRTTNLRKKLRASPPIALATLAASMARSVLFDVLQHRVKLRSEPVSAVLNADAGEAVYGSIEKALRERDAEGFTEADKWRKELEAGAKKSGSMLAWLLAQRPDLVVRLLVFLTSYAVVARHDTDATEPLVHAYAKAIGVDIATGWTLSPAWIAAQPKPYVLQQVAAHAGKAAATGLEKGKSGEFATAAFLALKGWVPAPLRGPLPAKKATAKKASKKA